MVLIITIVLKKQWRDFRDLINRRVLVSYSIAAVLISINWIVYIWAVNADHIVETSLGYFIDPVDQRFFWNGLFQREATTAALAVAGMRDYWRNLSDLSLRARPWIALVLASTFSLYGLVKKVAPLKSLFGLTLETAILVVPLSSI